jgi:cytochrome c-type biogenesis protein CcmF
MTPEIGQLCLILALFIAAIQSVLPVVGAQTGNSAWIGVARPAAKIGRASCRERV